MSTIARTLITLVAFACTVASNLQLAQALPAYTLNLPVGHPVDGDTGTYSMGFEFTTSQDFNIDSLGYNANNQFSGVHRVGIFDVTSQALLTSADVNVPSGNFNLNAFVYQSLSAPYVLPAGTYRIAGTTFNYPTSGTAYGYIFSGDNSHYVEAAGISYGDGTFTQAPGNLFYPTTITSNNFYNVNFQFSEIPPPAPLPAPEPTSLALCGIALCGVAVRRRRSARITACK